MPLNFLKPLPNGGLGYPSTPSSLSTKQGASLLTPMIHKSCPSAEEGSRTPASADGQGGRRTGEGGLLSP